MAASAPISTSSTSTYQAGTNYKPALGLLTSLFFMWGFITCLNDILIPHLKAIFDMTYTKTMLIQFTFFGAYFLMSIPAGTIVGRIGYQKGIVLGLSISAFGALLFYPASMVISYPLFLTGFFILASGITILQVSANPYVAALGSPETASGRLNLTQALNSFGTTVAPLFGALLILSDETASAVEKAEAVQIPYIGIAVALLAIAGVFFMVKLPKIGGDSSISITGGAWGYKHLVLGAVGIFAYVGAEVSIGSFMINFFADTTIAGITESEAAKYVSLYWGGAMIGRFFASVSLGTLSKSTQWLYNVVIFVFAFLLAWYLTADTSLAATFCIFVALNIVAFQLGKNNASRTLAVFAAANVLLVTITIATSGHFAMWTIIAVGLFNSIMFPTIFTLAIDGLGKHTSQGSGILCMAIVGGALVPLLMGKLADTIGVHQAFFITLVCYGYILYYGLKGYRHKNE